MSPTRSSEEVPRASPGTRGDGEGSSAPRAGQYLLQGIPIKGQTLVVARRPPTVPESEEDSAEGERSMEDTPSRAGWASSSHLSEGEPLEVESPAPRLRLVEDPHKGKITRVQAERGEYIVGLAFYQNFDMEMDPRQIDFSPASSHVRFRAGEAPEQSTVSVVAADTGAVIPARYSVGLDGLVVECCQEYGVRSRCDDRPNWRSGTTRQELLFLPSTQIDVDVAVARKRRPGTLRISGSWPTVCIHLLFPSKKEALAAQSQLRAGVSRVINSLHALAPCGAPPLTWAPLNDRPGPPYGTRGPYLIGGYVLHTERNAGDDLVSSLLWAELWGPNAFGYVRLYLYNNHRPNGCYQQSICWPKPQECNVHLSGSVINIDYEDPDGKDHDPFTDEVMTYLAFRSDEEARLWMDIVASVYAKPSRSFHQSYAPKIETEDLDFRIGELNCTLNEARKEAVKEPLMICSNVSILGPRPDDVPMDEIAIEAREEREKDGLDMLEEMARIKLNATIPRGMVATETTEILSM